MKYSFYSIGVVALIIGAGIFFNSISCVTYPKLIEGEPIICQKSSQWMYYSIMSKNQVPESNSTKGIDYCAATLREEKCYQRMETFLEKREIPKDAYKNLLLMNQALSVYDRCMKDTK